MIFACAGFSWQSSSSVADWFVRFQILLSIARDSLIRRGFPSDDMHARICRLGRLRSTRRDLVLDLRNIYNWP